MKENEKFGVGLQLIHFDVPSILKHAAVQLENGAAKGSKRRKIDRNSNGLVIGDLHYTDFNESIRNKDEDKTFSKFEWVVIANRQLRLKSESPILIGDFSNKFQDLNGTSASTWQLQTEEIKVSIDSDDQLILIKSKTNSKLKSSLLLSINIASYDKKLKSVLRNELSIINSPAPKRNFNTLSFDSPLLTIIFDAQANEVDIAIDFNIRLKSGVFNFFPSDLISKISSIVLSKSQEMGSKLWSFDTDYNLNEPISPRLFYNVISHQTSKIPKVEKHFDIPELNTNLLKFQRKSVNWFLEKEGVAYDWETSRCIEVPLVDHDTIEGITKYLQDRNCDQEGLDHIDYKLLSVLNRFCFGWSRFLIENEIYFFNKYSGNILKRITAYEYFLFYHDQQNAELYPKHLPAQGLLAEEMGLGKTVEVTTAILMNQRPIDEINEPVKLKLSPYGDVKIVIKARTTLIIAPDSILKQWVEEISTLAPSLTVTIYGGVGNYPKLQNNATLVAEYLRSFDVVFTTYSTISKELDYALYSSKVKPTRTATKRKYTYTDDQYDIQGISHRDPNNNNEKSLEDALKEYRYLFQLSLSNKRSKMKNSDSSENKSDIDYEKELMDEIQMAVNHNKLPPIYSNTDYQSPLMLSQFWRVVLDEVQMVSSKLSRAFQSAALIPRFHAWGVSGTPIKKDLNDLHSILKFLKIRPFDGNAKYFWKTFTMPDDGSNKDFIRLWTIVGLRHTKAMVHDDIQLPPQNRVLMTIPFTAVEQENYNQTLEECLATICLDINGNPVSDDWEPSPTVLAFMRSWLVRLRQICCNPQIGKLNISSKKYKTRSHGFQGRTVNTIQELKTLENVLDDMLARAADQISEAERQLIQLYIDVGQFEEYILEPKRALEFLEMGVIQTQRIIHRLDLNVESLKRGYQKYKIEKNIAVNDEDQDDEVNEESTLKFQEDAVMRTYEEKIKTTKLRIRAWNILLHKFYFLIASGYFQLYDSEYQDKIRRLGTMEAPLSVALLEFKDKSVQYKSDEISTLINGIPHHDLNFKELNYLKEFEPDSIRNEEERRISQFIFLESKFYDLAEKARQSILKSSIRNVEKVVYSRITSKSLYCSSELQDNGSTLLPKSSKSFFNALPIIDIDPTRDLGISMRARITVDKIDKLIMQLNEQARVINSWMTELVSILCKPLVTHDKNPDGEEYEDSIRDQDKVSCYLHVLVQSLTERSEYVLGGGASVKIVSVKKQQEHDMELELQKINDAMFLNNLQEKRKVSRPSVKTSLNEALSDLRSIDADLRDEEFLDSELLKLQLNLIESLSKKLRIVFENQKVSQVLLQKEISQNCNAVFNARIDYFKQLQQISDSVKPQSYALNQDNLNLHEIDLYFRNFTSSCMTIKSSIDKAIAKFRYLKSLVKPEKSDDNDDSLTCIICRSMITIGSLTQCGHKYCKECLEQWLRNNRTCPMCKSSISMNSVYNFTHHKPNLKMNQVEEKKSGDKANSNLYSIYRPVERNIVDDIQKVRLKNSYSSKVDLIVKQVLYLKEKDPTVQIVIFSQWQDLLYILGTAFKTVNISYLGSYGTLTPEVGGGRRRSKYESVEEFKDTKRGITCFLLNAKAQASGLTLINATHIFLCEPLVNTSLELQAISRIHRIGQTKETTVWMFAIENTVEESIVLMSTNKRLQYLDQNFEGQKNKGFRGPGGSVLRSEGRSLSKAESIALMNSGGIDTLINKGNGEGETVTNADLWNAFFSTTSVMPSPIGESNS